MVKILEPLNSRVHFKRHVQCTVHHLSMSRFEGLILSRIVNRHMELQTNEGHPFEGRKGMGRFDIVLVFCYTQSQAKSKKVII